GDVLAAGEGRLAGGEAENDRAPGFGDGAADGLDLAFLHLVVGAGDVVHLDEIDAPLGIHGHERVVVFLSAGAADIDAIHIRIPTTGAGGVGDVGGAFVGAEDGGVLL